MDNYENYISVTKVVSQSYINDKNNTSYNM